MDSKLVKLAFKYSQLAYEEATIENEKTDTQILIVELDDMLIVAPRGTSSGIDWRQDLKRIQKETGKGDLHAGFLECYDSVEEAVCKVFRNKRPGQKVLICGHSLGGALAQIIFAKFCSTMKDCECITFGAPYVGDEIWWSYIPKQRITLIENFFDFITKVPRFGYHKPKKCIKRFWSWPRFKFGLHFMSWHLLECYQKYINKL